MKKDLAEQLNSIIESGGGVDEIPDPYAGYYQIYLRVGEYELAAYMLLDAFVDGYADFDPDLMRELIDDYNMKTPDQERLELRLMYSEEEKSKKVE